MKVLGGLFGLIAVVALVAALLLEGPKSATAASTPAPAAKTAAH
jgi:hypothetical protein